MKVEIWSDICCPWCYIGKRRFEKALLELPAGTNVDIQWRSYQISPTTPKGSGEPVVDFLVRHKGIAPDHAKLLFKEVTGTAGGEGLKFRFDLAQHINTFDGHRLIHFASSKGKGDAMKERLLSAYFERGESIGDLDKLISLAKEVGLDEEESRSVLQSNQYASGVREDETMARKLGCSGVPFFLIDGKYQISGAQQPNVIANVLKTALKASNENDSGNFKNDLGGGVCNEDGCQRN